MIAGTHAALSLADGLERPATRFAAMAGWRSVVRESLEQAADLAPPVGSVAGHVARRLALASDELRALAVIAELRPEPGLWRDAETGAPSRES